MGQGARQGVRHSWLGVKRRVNGVGHTVKHGGRHGVRHWGRHTAKAGGKGGVEP